MKEQQSESSAATNPETQPDPTPAPVSLGKWDFYFIVKLLLFWRGMIGFHPLENLAFAAFLLIPAKSRLWHKVKQVAAVLLGLGLLYYDSWLPSFGRALSQAALVSKFDTAYLLELAGRFISLNVIAMLVIAWVAYRFIAPRVRLGLIVIGCMALLAIFQQKQGYSDAQSERVPPLVKGEAPRADEKPDLNKLLRDFYAKEATRSVAFPVPPVEALPFDVIFIHICSLSWDDIRAVGLEQHPLWKRFDFLFTHFNSAASYSGPAAIRILRATCGQASNDGLYQPVADRCYLMNNLRRSGFEPQLAMNHDGHFDDFLKTLQAQHLNVPPMPLDGASVVQHAFDGAPIYDDLSVLMQWMENRQKSDATRVALYYNTISLHDGNRLVGRNSKLGSIASYKIRLAGLLDELEKFMLELEHKGRRAVLVMVPEHGAAVQGDPMQIAGLREIPSPRITLVPVGIKVIGEGGLRQGNTLMLDAETSYLAISQIVAHMLEVSPFSGSGFNPADYVSNLAITPLVSQNESAVVMRYNNRTFWHPGNKEWGEYH